MKTAVDEVYSALAGNFRGDLLCPDSPGYTDAKRIWNGMVARTPGLIARCADVADIQSAVRAARECDVVTAVRCGGHSLAGHSTCDGGLVIDLALLRQIDEEGISEVWVDMRYDTEGLWITINERLRTASGKY